MIDYSEIKEVLREGIWNDLEVYFVELENEDPRPDNQEDIDRFISHKITTPYMLDGKMEYNDGNTLVRESTAKMTISLTCYSRDKGKVLSLCRELVNWFDFQGYEYLKDNDLIVVSVESVTDRTTFLETGYDNRIGFDVILRTTDRATREIDVIETVSINDDVIEA